MSKTLHSLDTSFVIRLLTEDPQHLFEKATQFIGERAVEAPSLEVCDLVLAESYFALLHHYGFSKPDALAALLAFSRHPAIAVSAYAQTALALPGIATVKPGFVDRLIHGCSRASGRVIVTFEKSARALPETLVLE